MMKRHTKTGIGCAIILAFIPVWLFALYYGFQALDCKNAKRHLRVLEACEADARCMLTERELAAYSSFIKLEAARCQKDKRRVK